jgi:hypothetical protein
MSGCKSFTFYDKGLDWFKYCLVALNAHLFIRNLVESPNCICGITETVSHFLLDCPRHTTLRQQLFFSLLDIPDIEGEKMYVACIWKLHNLLENNNTKRLNKIEKVKNIM